MYLSWVSGGQMNKKYILLHLLLLCICFYRYFAITKPSEVIIMLLVSLLYAFERQLISY